MSENTNVWADGFGRWHASVPLSGDARKDAREARRLIVAALAERYAPIFDPTTVHVSREHITNHGTAKYIESRRVLNVDATPGYRAITGEIRTGDFDDPWGTAMGWLFALAEVAYVRFGELHPAFRPGALLSEESIREESYEGSRLFDLIDSGEVDEQDLRDVHTTMSRYADVVRAAGRDY